LDDPGDVQRLRDAVRLCVRLLEDPAFQAILDHQVSPTDADLVSDAALDHWLRHNVTSSYHLAGTCKMGPASDPMAVVDQWCHVHGLSGVRVADASIMADAVRANTNVTTMMIAERCADFIKAGQ
jgi:choline dehydrogenase